MGRVIPRRQRKSLTKGVSINKKVDDEAYKE